MTVHPGPLIVDAADPEAVTTFWESAALGARVVADYRPERVTLADVDAGGNEVSAPGRGMPAG